VGAFAGGSQATVVAVWDAGCQVAAAACSPAVVSASGQLRARVTGRGPAGLPLSTDAAIFSGLCRREGSERAVGGTSNTATTAAGSAVSVTHVHWQAATTHTAPASTLFRVVVTFSNGVVSQHCPYTGRCTAVHLPALSNPPPTTGPADGPRAGAGSTVHVPPTLQVLAIPGDPVFTLPLPHAGGGTDDVLVSIHGAAVRTVSQSMRAEIERQHYRGLEGSSVVTTTHFSGAVVGAVCLRHRAAVRSPQPASPCASDMLLTAATPLPPAWADTYGGGAVVAHPHHHGLVLVSSMDGLAAFARFK